MSWLRRRRSISPAMVVAFVALSVALGGSSYAATKIGARSVGSKELKRSAIARSHIKNNAINSTKVADNSLTGSDINEATLGTVPLAAKAATADKVGTADRAATAGSADHATATAAFDRVYYRTVQGTVGAATTDPQDPTGTVPTAASATAVCDAGHLVVGGGARVEDVASVGVDQDFPDQGGKAWTATVANDDTSPQTFTVYAICVPAGSAG